MQGAKKKCKERLIHGKYLSETANGQISVGFFFFIIWDVTIFYLRGLLFGITKLILLKGISSYSYTTGRFITLSVLYTQVCLCVCTHVSRHACAHGILVYWTAYQTVKYYFCMIN